MVIIIINKRNSTTTTSCTYVQHKDHPHPPSKCEPPHCILTCKISVSLISKRLSLFHPSLLDPSSWDDSPQPLSLALVGSPQKKLTLLHVGPVVLILFATRRGWSSQPSSFGSSCPSLSHCGQDAAGGGQRRTSVLVVGCRAWPGHRSAGHSRRRRSSQWCDGRGGDGRR